LLLAVDKTKASSLLEQLQSAFPKAAMIGEVTQKPSSGWVRFD
jgi:hypothetical protein